MTLNLGRPILAQAIPPGVSNLAWALDALSSISAILAILAGVLIFCGASYLVFAKRRIAVIAAYLVVLPLPVMIALCGWMNGTISSLTVIAASPNLQLTTADIAGGVASSLL